ncbi:MAG TPA: ribosome recycling factor [Firmicutes bacterium]|nr:ribosome recycling factor [Bacillota bacterium]
MVKDRLKSAETRMRGVVDATRHEFASIRTGRANPQILHRLQVEAYGSLMPLDQLANVSAPEGRLLVVTPFDKHTLKDIERAILKSDLGLTPANDGTVIRLAIPPLTEERRRELVKTIRKQAEEARVAVRNVRREGNEALKAAEKKGEITEDDSRRGQEEMQKLTDKYIAEIDELVAAKEKEIMEV